MASNDLQAKSSNSVFGPDGLPPIPIPEIVEIHIQFPTALLLLVPFALWAWRKWGEKPRDVHKS